MYVRSRTKRPYTKEKTLRWRFKVVHGPGKNHHVANALLRYPVETLKEEAWKPNKKRTCQATYPVPTNDSEELEEANRASMRQGVVQYLPPRGKLEICPDEYTRAMGHNRQERGRAGRTHGPGRACSPRRKGCGATSRTSSTRGREHPAGRDLNFTSMRHLT